MTAQERVQARRALVRSALLKVPYRYGDKWQLTAILVADTAEGCVFFAEYETQRGPSLHLDSVSPSLHYRDANNVACVLPSSCELRSYDLSGICQGVTVKQ